MTRQFGFSSSLLHVLLLAALLVISSAVPRPQTIYLTGPVVQPGVVLLQHELQPAIVPSYQLQALHPQLLLRADENPAEGSNEGASTEKPAEGGGGGWGDWLTSFLPSGGIGGGSDSSTTAKPEAESTSTAPAAAPPAGAPTRLEELEPALPAGQLPIVPFPSVHRPAASEGTEQRYIPGPPQFFGNYAGLKRLGIQNLHNKGALPPAHTFLLGRGQPLAPGAPGSGYAHLGGKPEPEKFSEPAGTAAIAFQKMLLAQRFAEQQSAGLREKPSEENEGAAAGDAEDVEAGESPGPSVAQVKPQAIALAGPGGVASAAPVGTALVGPGGLAVAAPAATAVAGPSGGAPLVVPASTSKVIAAYFRQPAAPGTVRAPAPSAALRYQRGTASLPAVVALDP